MNRRDSSSTSRSGPDTIDISQKSYTDFPTIVKPNFVLLLNASKNLFKKLPNMSGFTALHDLDLSQNKFTDLSPLSSIINLRVLNISFNRIVNLDFIQYLPNLEELNVSHNKIREIDVVFPRNLFYVDLSHNELTSLLFFDKKLPSEIDTIDVSFNLIDQIIELKYLSVFSHLRVLKTDFIEHNSGLPLPAFAKHLCPSLMVFDDIDLENIDETIFDEDENFQDILIHGSEKQLRDYFGNEQQSQIMWDEPTFIKYEVNYPPSPLKSISDRLNMIENQFQKRFPTNTTALNNNDGKTETLLSPYKQQDDITAFKMFQKNINELKQQIQQVVEILYVHDRALMKLWDEQ